MLDGKVELFYIRNERNGMSSGCTVVVVVKLILIVVIKMVVVIVVVVMLVYTRVCHGQLVNIVQARQIQYIFECVHLRKKSSESLFSDTVWFDIIFIWQII